MFKELKLEWEQIRDDRPGQRFQNCYVRRHEPGVPITSRILFPLAGLLAIAAGLVLIPAPGPGSIILLFGLGLVGTEIRPLACFVDCLEVKARSAKERVMKTWSAAPIGAKLLLATILVALAGAAGYTGYSLFLSVNVHSPRWPFR